MKKFFGVLTAVAFAVAVAVPSASALTLADVELLITLGIIPADKADDARAALGGSASTGAGSSAYCGFSQDLTLGSQNAEVVSLQTALEAAGTLVIPAGVSKGYFGPLTQSALASWQAQNGVSPAAGYFGPVTRAAFAAMCSSAPSTGTGSTGSTGSTDGLSGDEASLEDYKFSDGNDNDVEEGDTAEVAEIEFDVEDGDVRLERLDLSFEVASTTDGGENDPWDAFDTITLWANGEEIASEDVSDEDDWLDNDDPTFVFRFSGLDAVFEEGETTKIVIEVEAQKSVDDADTAGVNDWIVYVDEDDIRALDAVGIDQYIGDSADKVTFGIEEAGADEEIKIKSSSSDPDSRTIEVKENDRSDWEEVFVFSLKAEENDIDLETLDLTVTTGSANYEDVVNDIRITIDGDEYDENDATVTNPDSTTADLSFDIDKDTTIDADSTVKVVVEVEFRSQSGNYSIGETIMVTATEVTGEGVDDVSDTAALDSEEHTLALAVADVSVDAVEVNKADDDNSGTISFEFTVDASDADDDVTFDVADNVVVDGATDDVRFTVTGTDTGIATTTLTLLDGDATFAGGTWTVAEGDSATFALDTTFTTVDAGDNGTYRVKLESVAGVTLDETSGALILSF